MPLFQSTTAFDADIEKATSEYNTGEDWQVIIDICDKIKNAPNGPKDGLRAIMKRISHRVPHVSLQAVTLLAACVNNCGKQFHLEICSRDWINEARMVITRGHPRIADKLKENIEQWAEDFKNDPQLNLIPQFYRKLKSEGVSFPSKSDTDPKKKAEKGDIDFKEDLDLAIALSLQDAGPPAKAPSQELYPTAGLGSLSTPQREPRKVRALYDFEAAEDNEISFKAGEIILVSDDSDQNWWKGENARGAGLFPSNFVTSDLTEAPPEVSKKEKKKVRFSDEDDNQKQQVKETRPKAVISEEKIETCLAMLKNASPTEEDDEEENIRDLEDSCNDMALLIQTKMAESEKKRTDYEDFNQQFIQAITLYQQSMKEPIPTPTPPVYGSSPKQYQQVPGMQSYSQSAYVPQMQQQMVMASQLPPASAQPAMQYVQASNAALQRQGMDAVYASQGPPTIPVQQQYTTYQQPTQSTGYTEAAYYASAQPTSLQDSYAQSQQGVVYDYGMASQQQQQHGQLYSQATVYQ